MLDRAIYHSATFVSNIDKKYSIIRRNDIKSSLWIMLKNILNLCILSIYKIYKHHSF